MIVPMHPPPSFQAPMPAISVLSQFCIKEGIYTMA